MKTPAKQQRGFVLVTAMIFLLVLAFLGVMALRGSFFEARVAGNLSDQALAREYAEMALRDAERDIMGLRFDGQYCAPAACNPLRPDGTRPKSDADANFWGVQSATNPEVAFVDGGRTQGIQFQGMYNWESAAACGKPIWSGADWSDAANPARTCENVIAAPVPTIPYGTFTQAVFVGPDGNPPRGIPLPRYMIEVFPAAALMKSSSQKVFFRITAVGFGRTVGPAGRTSITLQSIYSPV